VTLICSICKELVSGPLAPSTLIDQAEKSRIEFQALYPAVYQHIVARHGEMVPMLRTIIDTVNMVLLSKAFQSPDPTFGQLLTETADAACNTLRSTFQFEARPPAPAGKTGVKPQNGKIIL
jgi:hypothetical protein